MSLADQAALESALAEAEARSLPLTAITVGPVNADRALREALTRGVTRAIRVDAGADVSSIDVARALVGQLGDIEHVWCGDYSNDRGSGSVPAFIAALSGRGQALGSVSVTHLGDGTLSATRRLDGGRREVLEVRAPGVVSVEGATARLRRASLPALRAARDAAIEVTSPATPVHGSEWPVRPYRPRARVLAAPAGETPLDRLRVLTDAAAASAARGETVALDPAAAAARIVQALRDWGYLEAAT